MPKKRQARKKRQRRGLWRRIVAGGVVLLIGATSLVAWIAYRELTYDLPSVDKLLRYELPVATRVFANDGTLLGEFYTEKRYLVPIARIPPVVRQAFIAAEDSNFYRHRGVDVSGIARAAMANFTAGGVVQGGSTITQQVVKSLLLTPEKSYERKAKEILLSLRLERELSKDEILYLYLNLIYLGSGSYGIGAAAKEYFGKDVSQLTVAEAALLAGLPQAPSRYSPRRHWKRAKHRQRYVLERMAREKFVTWKEAEQALRTPIALTDHGDRTPAYLAAPYFVEHVRRLLEERYGGTVLRNAGLNVHTTVDLADQHLAEKALREQLRKVDRGRTGARPLRRLSTREAERYLAKARAGKSARNPVPGRSYRGLILGPGGRRWLSGATPRFGWTPHQHERRPAPAPSNKRSRRRATPTRPRRHRTHARHRASTRGGVGIDRPRQWRRPGPRRRLRFSPQPIQPRHASRPPTWFGLQAVRVRRGARPRLHDILGAG